MVGALISSYTVKKIGRKTLLIWGNLAIAAVHITIGLACSHGNINVAFIMIIIFILIFVNTSGPVAWIYAGETVTDTGLGVCLLFLWITLFILSFICPILMSSNSIGPINLFYIFSGISILATAYSIIFIKETKGLPDKRKKLLYTPKQYLIHNDISLDPDQIS